MNVLQKLKTILEIPSVTSKENLFFDWLETQIPITRKKDYSFFIPKNPIQILLAVHVDRCGLIMDKKLHYSNYIVKIKENIKIKPNKFLLKKISDRFLNEQMCLNNKPINIISSKINHNNVTFSSDKKLKKGDALSFYPSLKVSNKTIKGQLDNSISIASILSIQSQFPIIFTTKEECGLSYKQIIKFAEQQKINKVIILDTTTEKKLQNEIVIRTEDDFGKYDSFLVKKLIKIAKDKNIPYKLKKQRKGKTKRGTEAGKIIKETKSKIKAATIQIPTINNHHSYEETTKEALKNYLKMIKMLNQRGNLI